MKFEIITYISSVGGICIVHTYLLLEPSLIYLERNVITKNATVPLMKT